MTALSRLLARSAAIIAIAALAGILLLVAAQVGLRVATDRSLPWPEEMARILFIYLVFIGAAETSANRNHIAVDLVDTFGLSETTDRRIDVLRNLATLAVLGTIAYGAAQMIPVVNSMRLPSTGLRMSVMVLPVLVGSALMLVATLVNLFQDLTGRVQPRDEAP